MDFATAKSLLQRKEGAGSVYEHVTELILKVLTDQPANALETFEKLSALVKAGSFPAPAVGTRVGGEAGAAEHSAAVANRLKALGELFKPAATEDGAAGESVQDLTDEAVYMEWAGVSLGRTDAFRLHLSLRHLAAKYPVTGLRFWGKLLGTSADYIVAEGVLEAADEEEDGKDALGNTIQKTGEGPNKHTYFVAAAIGEPWVKLPNVTPHQVSVARVIRRYLTGKLDAPVKGHPPFPGVEANFVRALIALISAGTVIAPTGAYTPVDGDEEGNIQANEEEWEAPDLASADSWVHTALELNRLGRTKPNPLVVNEEGEEVADPDAPDASAPLRSISEDPPVDEAAEEGGGAWDVRPVSLSGVVEGEPTGIVVVKSLRWPGAVTVGFNKKRYANVYVGYGHEVALTPYQPQLPKDIPTEYDFTSEAQVVKEQLDVITDPDAGKVAEGEEEEAEE